MGIKLINESGLSSVADAIRAKTGTSEALEWPQGFIDAISALQAPVSVNDIQETQLDK